MTIQSFRLKAFNTIDWALNRIIEGKSALHLVESGVSVFINQNRATEAKPKTRAIVALNPVASILIKKKPFSTYKAVNDLRWMDKTEKMLLRATKALFALKVSQLRAYESLTKLEKFYEETKDLNFTMLADLISSSRYLKPPGASDTSSGLLSALSNFGVAAGVAATADDMIKIIRRNAFSTANTKTTWIVDPDDVQNYGTGPGTGVIELCTFSSLSTSTGITSDAKSASFEVVDPHRIMNIIEDDIETAIEEALYGTLGLMNDLAYAGIGGEYIDPTLVISSSLELFGLGGLDGTIDIDYIRDRLRVFYLGKWLISVGDGVHVFISGNKSVSRNSEKHSDPFDTSLDESYFKIDDTILEAERRLYTNQNISSDSYKKIRSYSNDSFRMQHVFGGYVKTVSETYSPDKSNISVRCVDNMGWLTSVRFLEEPSLLNPRAPLEDPLSPYDIKSTEFTSSGINSGLNLLPENKALLKSGLLSFDKGILAGYNANESNIYQGQYSGTGSMFDSRIVQHPSGLVYRWKSGVLALTLNSSPNGGSGGNVADATSKSARQNYGFVVTNSVVSNLDVANVISVLVTGQPYNIETFTSLSYDAMNVVRKNNSYAPAEALSYVLDSIRKQNPFYGNFKPFRMITMSDLTINKLSSSSFLFEDTKNEVVKLRAEKNLLKRQKRILQSYSGSSSMQIASLDAKINSIDAIINSAIKSAYNNGNPSSGAINASDLFDLNFNIFGQNQTLKKNGNLESDHDLTRAMMKVATMRRIEDVKLNRDQNLLIISDQYDLNPDIKASIIKIGGSNLQLFSGNFLDVYTRCKAAADVTMVEFFCNTQGHLEVRPAQYNKTPLSVLNALYSHQQNTNKKIVPDFLFTMFTERLSSLKLEIHCLNVKIAIIAMLLGTYPDANLVPGVPSKGPSSFNFFGVYSLRDKASKSATGNGTDSLMIDKSDITLSNTSSTYFHIDLFSDEDGDILNGDIKTEIGNFDAIIREFGTSSGVSIYDKTLDSLTNPNKENVAVGSTSEGNISEIGSESDVLQSINQIVSDFKRISGWDPSSDLTKSGNNGEFIDKDLLFSKNSFQVNNDRNVNSGAIELKIDALFKKLETAISSRNSLIRLVKNNEEKRDELERINSDLENGFSEDNTDLWEDPDFQKSVNTLFNENPSQNGDLSSDTKQKAKNSLNIATDIYKIGRGAKRIIDATRKVLTGSANKGTLFDHLIDDDTRNLLGPGSGRRFIIYDEQIYNYTVSENEPDFTRIDLFGSTNFVNDEMRSVTGNENLIKWAGAADYDLWRQYGYKSKSLVDLPFMTDAETQGKPLALQHLSLQRTAIFSGTVSVAGNEYYQPGDTIYIPSKGLLFYVISVSHSLSIGSSFSTTLTISYGHPPGVYLPTPMDIIGQSYSKDFLTQGDYLVNRSVANDSSYHPLLPSPTINFPSLPKITFDNVDYLLSHKDNMVRYYNMVTDISNGLLSSSRVVLIRGFRVLEDDDDELEDIKEKLLITASLLQNPVMLSQKLNTSLGDDLLADTLQPADALFNINASSGLNKELVTMSLPNSLPTYKVGANQILLQIVNLKREKLKEVVSNIKQNNFTPDNSRLLNSYSTISDAVYSCYKLSSDGKSAIELKNKDSLGKLFGDRLPVGGPCQDSWLEMEELISSILFSNSILNKFDILNKYERVVEIGVLDLDPASIKLLMSAK